MSIVTIGDEQFEVCEEVAQEIESLRKGMENIAHHRALAEMENADLRRALELACEFGIQRGQGNGIAKREEILAFTEDFIQQARKERE